MIIGLYASSTSSQDTSLIETYDKLFDIVFPECDVMIVTKNAPLTNFIKEKIENMDSEITLYEIESTRYLSPLLKDLLGY